MHLYLEMLLNAVIVSFGVQRMPYNAKNPQDFDLLEIFFTPKKHKKYIFIPQRRGSLKNLSEGSHLFECSLSFILLFWKIFTPLRSMKNLVLLCGWCGGGVVVVVWGVFTSEIF